MPQETTPTVTATGAPAATATPTPAAPAEPIPATQAAVVSGDTTAYRRARLAERRGEPLPPVATPAPSATETTATAPEATATTTEPTAEARELSKRQQRTNEVIRDAVERATAGLQAELAALRRQAAPTVPEATATPKADGPPAKPWERYMERPGRPKVEDFDSLDEHAVAMSLWLNDQIATERAEGERAHALTAAQQQRVERFMGQVEQAKAADPAFIEKLSPEVLQLRRFDDLLPGERATPRTFIADQIWDSPIAPKVLLHLSKHPEVLTAMETEPAHIKTLPPGHRVRAHMEHIVKQFGWLEHQLAQAETAVPAVAPTKTLTDAPAVETLGRRATAPVDARAAAIRTGDTRAYREMRRRERAGLAK